MAGSTGVLPPPKGYLQKLRQICDQHGILLIFDEVITGFGRLGFAFAAERYGVVPDMITFAKGVNSGTVPMGGVIVRKGIYDAFMKGPEWGIELFHGYTYSAHPLACAAALAALDIYRDERLFERARALEGPWADAIMTLKGLPNVVDIRTLGLVGAIDLASKPDAVGARAYEAMERAFHDIGLMFRIAGDTIALSPPLIVSARTRSARSSTRWGRCCGRWGDPCNPRSRRPGFDRETAMGVLKLNLPAAAERGLARLAAQTGSSAEVMASEAVERFVAEELATIDGIERALDDMRHGRVIAHERVSKEVDGLLDRPER